jgi:flavin-dependent dehydrogenase
MSRIDVLVIGAGPAGAAAASILHDRGHRVRVVERSSFPRFVIGESLLPRSMDLLQAAGLLDAASARGYLRKHGAAFLRDGELSEFDFSEQFTPGWAWTWQVPRGDFDQTLIQAVADKGVEVLFEHTVVEVEPGPPARVTYETPEGRRLQVDAKFVVDASGYGRVLPRLMGLDRPSTLPMRHSLFAWYEGDVREEGLLEGRTWVCMHPGGAWIWVIPFSNGRTSVGVVADPGFFARYPEDLRERLDAILAEEPNVAARLASAKRSFEPVLIAGYSTAVSTLHGPGWVLVGNSGEFLDPVFSAGVTVALESAVLAADLTDRELGGEVIDWDAAYSRPLSGAIGVYRSFIDGWYSGDLPEIFFHAQQNADIKAQICSVLAGYLLDGDNPFVAQPKRKVPVLAKVLRDQAART